MVSFNYLCLILIYDEVLSKVLKLIIIYLSLMDYLFKSLLKIIEVILVYCVIYDEVFFWEESFWIFFDLIVKIVIWGWRWCGVIVKI